jgi:predicted ArsR family transcriptional regulator
MDRAGFVSTVGPAGDRLYLRGCPYAALVGNAPAICDLHLYLACATLGEHTDGVVPTTLTVDAAPGVCVLQLQRLDRPAGRVITRPEEGPAP